MSKGMEVGVGRHSGFYFQICHLVSVLGLWPLLLPCRCCEEKDRSRSKNRAYGGSLEESCCWDTEDSGARGPWVKLDLCQCSEARAPYPVETATRLQVLSRSVASYSSGPNWRRESAYAHWTDSSESQAPEMVSISDEVRPLASFECIFGQ